MTRMTHRNAPEDVTGQHTRVDARSSNGAVYPGQVTRPGFFVFNRTKGAVKMRRGDQSNDGLKLCNATHVRI